MLTKIALAAALIVAPLSATLASDNGGKTSRHARASYGLAHLQQSPNADSTDLTGPVRPVTGFEKSWFDYQAQE